MEINTAKIDRRIKIMPFITAIGGLCFGYDTGVISGALLFMGADLNLTPVTEGWVTSSLLIGACIGSVFGGSLSDSYGRRKIMLVVAIMFAIGAIGTAIAWDVTSMVSFRIFLGLAVGGASVIVPVYIGEITPKRYRETLTSVNEVMIVSGQLLAYSVNAAIAIAYPESSHNWRWMLAIPALPAILLWFGILKCPESPRWFAKKGRLKEAKTMLEQYRNKNIDDIEQEYNSIVLISQNQVNNSMNLFDIMQHKWARKLLMFGILIVVASQGTGVNAIMYYAPTVLKTTGLGNSAALVATIGNGIVSVCATIIGLSIIAKIHRRRMFITGQIGCTLSLFAIALTFNFLFSIETIGNEDLLVAHHEYGSYIVLLFMLTFLMFMQGFLGPVFWLMLSEIFPLAMRGMGMGISVLFCWIVNFLIALLFPILLSYLGSSVTFMIFGICNICFILLITKFLPETKGKSLEEIEIELKKGS